MKLFKLSCIGLLAVTFASTLLGEDGGKFSGAVWKYEMNLVSNSATTRKGAFRIDGMDIYQPRDKTPTKIGSIEGKKNQVPKKGDSVKVSFTALRGDDGKELNCKGPITWESLGEVNGRLIDADGAHWNFKASRIQE